MKELILHAGMNKTGSSSIQKSLRALSGEKINFLKWKWENHSDLFMLLFQDKILREKYHIFKTQGWSASDLDRETEIWQEVLSKELLVNKFETTLFSAEDASQPNVSVVAMQRFYDFFAPHFDRIRVIAYVRSPYSFANSAFQQRVKSGGIKKIDMHTLWPNYRLRFEKLDEVFGQENVFLVHFTPSELFDGDVVSDFCRRIDIELSDTSRTRANDSLSLEALSLLYYQRKYGVGINRGSRGSTKANNAFVHAISKIGSTKFQFEPEAFCNVLEENRSDLDWIEGRMGKSVTQDLSGMSGGVKTEEDLENVALKHWPDLLRCLETFRANDPLMCSKKLAHTLNTYAGLFLN
jgi:hypothetical protein